MAPTCTCRHPEPWFNPAEGGIYQCARCHNVVEPNPVHEVDGGCPTCGAEPGCNIDCPTCMTLETEQPE